MLAVDPFTRLQTRNQLDSYLAAHPEIEWVVRVDLDSFIFANDYLGHSRGDDALLRLAAGLATLAERYRSEAFRIGGDDFVALMPRMSAESMETTLSSLQADLALSEFSFGDHPYRPADTLSASFLAIPREQLPYESVTAILERLDNIFYAERASTIPTGEPSHFGPSKAKRAFVKVARSDA